jgi:hypothetical protein
MTSRLGRGGSPKQDKRPHDAEQLHFHAHLLISLHCFLLKQGKGMGKSAENEAEP